MKIRSIAFGAALAALAASPSLVRAETTTPLGETITPAFREALENVPGKSLVAIVVNYTPGGKSLPHHHGRSAFVTAYVLTGAIRSQVENGETRVYKAGEHWTEPPGAYHPVSENASATEPASLLAIFVADTDESDDAELTIFEQQ
jgi:quercetin dioxygenase-like cupin family protein